MSSLRLRAKELMIFLRGFLKEPIRVSTGFQSSRFMANALDNALSGLELADHCVVELGAGCGRLTERIVKRLGEETQLLCFESEPIYATYLRRKFDTDRRVVVIEDRAEMLPTYLRQYGLPSVPTIISAVPLSGRKNDRILRTIHQSLCDGGRVVQMALVRRRYFENEGFSYLKRHVCLLNVPPEFLHVCEKPDPCRLDDAVVPTGHRVQA